MSLRSVGMLPVQLSQPFLYSNRPLAMPRAVSDSSRLGGSVKDHFFS
jgi:hypothetical protein